MSESIQDSVSKLLGKRPYDGSDNILRDDKAWQQILEMEHGADVIQKEICRQMGVVL